MTAPRGSSNAARALALLACVIVVPACGPDCDELKNEAQALKLEQQSCQSGDTCVVANLYELAGASNCLGAFQCWAAFGSDADQAAFSTKAKKLVEDFKGCRECAMAGCAQPSGASCNAATGMCELSQ